MGQRTYIEQLTLEFKRLNRICNAALEQLGDNDVFVLPPNDGNSIAILMKHMSGNMRSRWRDFLTTDGEKPDRDRDSEFVITEADNRTALAVRWADGWDCLFDSLDSLSDGDLSKEVFIRGESHTVLQAINRQLSHYAYHAGQIVLRAKELAGPRWQTLSVAKGESKEYNEAPKPYLDEGV